MSNSTKNVKIKKVDLVKNITKAGDFYQGLNKDNTWVFATRIGAKWTSGDYPFHQAAILSGNSDIRGYRSERFYGDVAFYHNLELRGKLLTTSKRKLPSSFGFMIAHDYGRVWLSEESSDKWHRSYGGGLWIRKSITDRPVQFIFNKSWPL